MNVLSKNFFLGTFCLLFSLAALCQNSGIGIGTSSPNALLDVYSDDVKKGGILIPRYDIDEVSSLVLGPEHNSMLFFIKASPTGIMNGTGIARGVTSPGYYYFDSDTNELLKIQASKDVGLNWGTLGNSETTDAHFIGTLNDIPLKIKVNNNFSGFVGSKNLALGYNAFNHLVSNTTAGYDNVALGSNSLRNIDTGYNNVGIGFGTLQSGTAVRDNVAIGMGSLSALVDGYSNIALGKFTMNLMTAGKYNLGIGNRVMENVSTNTTHNVGIGYGVLRNVNATDGFNVGIGFEALTDGEGISNNVAIGRSSSASLVQGDGNVSLGRRSFENLENGNDNVAIGHRTAFVLKQGTNNIAIGTQSLPVATNANNNIIIGKNTAPNLTVGDNNIIIGNDTRTSAANSSNEVVIGNPTMTTYRMWSNGWTNLSDRKAMNAITPLQLGLAFVNMLKPTEFVFKDDVTLGKAFGFIAQDVQDALTNSNGATAGMIQSFGDNYLGLRMNDFISILTKAIQEQNQLITNQQNEINQLKLEIQAIKQAINLKI